MSTKTDMLIRTPEMGDMLISGLDNSPFKKIMVLYERRLYAFAWTLVYELDLTTDLVEDLVQHAWAKLFHTVLQGQHLINVVDQGESEQEQLCRWLLAVMRNKAVDCWRTQQHFVSLEEVGRVLEREQWSNQRFESLDARLLREDRTALLERIMQRYLSERQLKIIRMFYFEEFTLTQISNILEMPSGTVKSHHHRAIVLLRRAFREQNIPLEDLVA